MSKIQTNQFADIQPETLIPHEMPLHGVRLIEASAGTGKTYTIANLYLRILLGHGSEQTKHETPLTVDQILVVTFTEAATGELRDRIRARIHQAREAFVEGSSTDPFIQCLINSQTDTEQCQALLLAAEQQMDEAAIFTIHGFCHRILTQHAFESGTLFSSELMTDTEPLLQLCAEDYWRKKFYPLEKPLVKLIRSIWATPGDLLNHLRGWISLAELKLAGSMIPQSIDEFRKVYLTPALELKAHWLSDKDTITEHLTTCGLRRDRKPWTRLNEMNRFIASDDLVPTLGSTKDGWEVYGTEQLKKSLKKTGKLPQHTLFKKIDQFLALPVSLNDALKGLITREALQHIKTQLSELKTECYQLAFDDLLAGVVKALCESNDSGNAELLAQTIRKQYRIAMIDEFQDTDPMQYRIFNKIYMRSTDHSVGLFMIGDPKQSIYAFRGADIFTYMRARQQVHSHYSLDTNWRSSDAMVSAVNAFFQHSDAPFIFNDSIPFTPVHASPGAADKCLCYEEKALPAMTLWLQNPLNAVTINSKNYLTVMSETTATEINRLLSAADHGNCNIHTDDQKIPLQPGDIAVLVRSGSQARYVRDALAAQNIASIYLSNQDSVFASEEAYDLEKVLQACLYPTHERTLKEALATSLLEIDAIGLDTFNTDEQAWENVVEEFTHYGQLWQNKGIMPMLRQFIFRRKIAERLLKLQNGERRLTDLLHMGELLTVASLEHKGAPALIRWFSEQINHPNHKADDQQLHLESEQNLVKIITIHKSKGLEYSVVFLPFPCHVHKTKSSFPLYHEPDTKETWLSLISTDQATKLSIQESLAEELRLLYVALTRSVYCCYLGIAPYKSGRDSQNGKTDLHQTAIGYLLNDGAEIVAADLQHYLEQIAGRCQRHQMVISSLPESNLPAYSVPQTLPENQLVARTFEGNIETNWLITSYSSLTQHGQSSSDAHAVYDFTGLNTDFVGTSDSHPDHGSDKESSESWTVFNFPKGSRSGIFMHSLFENLDMNKLRSLESHSWLDHFLLEHHERAGFDEQWLPAIKGMLLNCLHASLDGEQLRLINLQDSARRVEMEFYLPLEQLDCHQLNQLITHYDPLSARAQALRFHSIKGMLKGFIDLTFEYDGCWYVLDYKSNWLGSTMSDYSQEAMERAMIEHRYDLQYQFYVLALHRLLKHRVADYNYERHCGGVFYLFLRGINKHDPDGHGIFSHKPSFELINRLDQLFSGARGSTA